MTRTTDAGGGWVETAADVATVWAAVAPLQGMEQMEAMQMGMSAPHRFVLRWRPGVTGASELVWDGRRFNVRSVADPEAARTRLVILADEVTS
jgi:SPP1 family predicted phage head-tail adaptor